MRPTVDASAWVVLQFRAVARGEAPNWRELRVVLEQSQLTGLVMVPQPGTILFAGDPILQVKLQSSHASETLARELQQLMRPHVQAQLSRIEVSESVSPALLQPGTDPQAWDIDDAAWAGLMQIYRQLGDDGYFTRDLVQPAAEAPLPGMVLLQRVWTGSQWTGGDIDDQAARNLTQRQRHAIRKNGDGEWVDLLVRDEAMG